MKPHTLAAIVVFAVVVVGYFFHRAAQERAKERAQTQAMRDMPLTDYCAHVAARDLDGEWLHLATLALTDWPPMPEDAELPRTW